MTLIMTEAVGHSVTGMMGFFYGNPVKNVEAVMPFGHRPNPVFSNQLTKVECGLFRSEHAKQTILNLLQFLVFSM